MDVIFKIAGWMILIVLILVILMVLVNNWDDIELFLSDFFSTSTEENSDKLNENDKFRMQIFDILKYKGRYDPKLQLRVYSDSNITIYENRKITWKHKTPNPKKDCIEYVDELHSLCLSRQSEMSKSIQEKARELVGGNELFQSGNLRIYSGERSSVVKISVAGQTVFCHDSIGGHISVHRPGKWEQELDRIFEERLAKKEKEAPEDFITTKELKRREAEEKTRNFSPIDDSKYF